MLIKNVLAHSKTYQQNQKTRTCYQRLIHSNKKHAFQKNPNKK